MKSVIGGVCAGVLVGFIACSGSTDHKAARSEGEGGDAMAAAGQAGAPTATAGGSSNVAGEANDGGASVGGASGGAALGGKGGLGGASVAGEGGAAGLAFAGAAGESAGGGGGAGGEAPVVDPICGAGMAKVGEYSLWCGKVNMHTDAQGLWQTDADCSSGCTVAGVSYCKKFDPTATAVATVPQVGTKDWKNAGCDDSTPDGPGISGQAACCAPLQ